MLGRKLLLLIFLSSFFMLLVYSQIYSQSWIGNLRGDEASLISSFPTSDGNIVCTGAVGNTTPCFFVLKISYSGEILWSKKIGTQGKFYGARIIETNDGGYLAYGSYSSTGNDDDYDILLVKLDEDGNVLWEKTYGGSKMDWSNSLVQDGEGNIYLLCSTTSFGSSMECSVIKLNPSGDIIWSKIFSSGYDMYGEGILMGNDGGVIIFGEVNYSDRDIPCLVKLDEDGNVIWGKMLKFKGNVDEDKYLISVISANGDGYILTGFVSVYMFIIKVDDSGNVLWQKNFGNGIYNSNSEVGSVGISITPTKDGNYAVFCGGSDYLAQDSGMDFLLIKMDGNGNILWSKGYGSGEDEEVFVLDWDFPIFPDMVCLDDNSFFIYPILKGICCSNFLSGCSNFFPETFIKTNESGDVTNCILCEDISIPVYDSHDYDLEPVDLYFSSLNVGFTPSNQSFDMKEPSVNVNKICGNNPKWVKRFGNMSSQKGFTIDETCYGNYIVGGIQQISDEDTDYLILSLSQDGNVLWENKYGGSKLEYLTDSLSCSLPNSDMPHIFLYSGYTNSFSSSGFDGLLLGVNYSDGSIYAVRKYSGVGDDRINSVCSDNSGYDTIAGITTSGTVNNSYDIWVAQIDQLNNFDIRWKKSYGSTGGGFEWCSSIESTKDGYILSGFTNAIAGRGYDFLVLKLDDDGNIEWQKDLGGDGTDYAISALATDDGGYIVAGDTGSFGAGGLDILIIKLDRSGNVLWSKTYGGSGDEKVFSLEKDGDGNYIISGITNSYGSGDFDGLIFKIDNSGNVLTEKVFGTQNYDEIMNIKKCFDGRYIVVGNTMISSSTYNMLILKLNTLCDLPYCLLTGECNLGLSNVSVTSEDLNLTVGAPAIVASSVTISPNSINNISLSTVCSPYSSGDDLNSDGFVNLKDAILLANYLVENISGSEIDLNNADVNGDGVVNVSDLATILVKIVSK